MCGRLSPLFKQQVVRTRVDSSFFRSETEKRSQDYDIYSEKQYQINLGVKNVKTRETIIKESNFTGGLCHDFTIEHKDSCPLTLHEISLLCTQRFEGSPYSVSVLSVTSCNCSVVIYNSFHRNLSFWVFCLTLTYQLLFTTLVSEYPWIRRYKGSSSPRHKRFSHKCD